MITRELSNGRANVGWSSYRLFGVCFILAALFPWISFGVLKLDTQPWFIMAALSMCFLSVRVKGDAILVGSAILLIATAMAAGFARMRAVDVLLLRGVLSYTAFGTVLLGYYFYRRRYGFPARLFLVANSIWLLAGIAQLAFGTHLFDAIVVVRTNEARGVTALAPEPTYFGMVLLFFSWIFLIEGNYRLSKKLWLLIVLNVLSILLVAKSAMALAFIFYLLVVFVLFGITTLKRFLFVTALLVMAILATSLVSRYFPDWRIVQVITALVDNPMLAIRADASINERLSHFAFAIYGAVHNYGIPGGFGTFGDIVSTARVAFGGLFWYGDDDLNKIESGVGAVVYELGWLSIVFFVIVVTCTISRAHLRFGFFHLVGFIGLFAGALPVAFPFAPILLITMFIWSRRSSPESELSVPDVPLMPKSSDVGDGAYRTAVRSVVLVPR